MSGSDLLLGFVELDIDDELGLESGTGSAIASRPGDARIRVRVRVRLELKIVDGLD